jgi:hypothetical protein
LTTTAAAARIGRPGCSNSPWSLKCAIAAAASSAYTRHKLTKSATTTGIRYRSAAY